MSELVEFIRGCLDADEQTARAASRGPWWHEGWTVFSPPPEDWSGPHAIADAYVKNDAAHIARHDPARVLAEVNAKRAILDAVTSGWFDSDIEVVLPLLAQPYAGEPGWRDEWGTQ